MKNLVLRSGIWARLKAWLGGGMPPPGGQTVATAAVLVAAAAFVGPWEGLRTEAYLDRIAQPPVWTVCYGETRGIGPASRFTEAECSAQLLSALGGFYSGLLACLPQLASQPEGIKVALTSWSYNVGTAAACGSRLVSKARSGDWLGACAELPRWNRAGGKVIAGLSRRRAAEQTLCVQAAGGI